jgi:septal ring factor EnvC (AmiA/AmiB activator)
MTITTEEAERLVELGKVVPDGSRRIATAISTLAAERDALKAERNAERSARFKVEAEFSHTQRRIARQRRALAKLYQRRHDRKAKNARLRAALRELIYETTHLSPQEDDGSHRCTITGETLRKARAALGEKE